MYEESISRESAPNQILIPIVFPLARNPGITNTLYDDNVWCMQFLVDALYRFCYSLREY